jgi:hypothetical protein
MALTEIPRLLRCQGDAVIQHEDNKIRLHNTWLDPTGNMPGAVS